MALRTRLPKPGDRVRLAGTDRSDGRVRYGTVVERDDRRSLTLRVAWDGTAPRHIRTEAWLPDADRHWRNGDLAVVAATEGLVPQVPAVPETATPVLFQAEEVTPRFTTPAQDSADHAIWTDEAWLDEALAALDRGATVAPPASSGRPAARPASPTSPPASQVTPSPGRVQAPVPVASTAAARLFDIRPAATAPAAPAPAPEAPWDLTEDLLPAKRSRRSRILQHR